MASLRQLLPSAGLRQCIVAGRSSASWGQLCGQLANGLPLDRYRGRSVLLAVEEPLPTIAALLALDGVARRIVLLSPGLPADTLPVVAAAAEADLLLSEQPVPALAGLPRASYGFAEEPAELPGGLAIAENTGETEWVLLTSGTTGVPKLVSHTLGGLTTAISEQQGASRGRVWSTFYDIRRYGGLQIVLRAALTGSSLVLADSRETPAEFLDRAGAHGVTHISGTPSHWRRALMSAAAARITPQYIRLSGEIADQPVLHQLRANYPEAAIVHAFATTEAGVLFEVEDGLAGLPVHTFKDMLQGTASPAVQAKLEGGTLRVRSPGAASRYLGPGAPPLTDAEGFIDTRDALELRNGRYHFAGRSDGTINVGGLKVHPEEVEAVLNSHPRVSMSLVKTRKSPVTGALVAAEIVLKTGPGSPAVAREILAYCRETLTAHKVPAAVAFVPALPVTPAGKLVRSHA